MPDPHARERVIRLELLPPRPPPPAPSSRHLPTSSRSGASRSPLSGGGGAAALSSASTALPLRSKRACSLASTPSDFLSANFVTASGTMPPNEPRTTSVTRHARAASGWIL